MPNLDTITEELHNGLTPDELLVYRSEGKYAEDDPMAAGARIIRAAFEELARRRNYDLGGDLDAVRAACRDAMAEVAADERGGPRLNAGTMVALARAYVTLGGDLELPTPEPPTPAVVPDEVGRLIREACGFVANLPGLPEATDRADELRAHLVDVVQAGRGPR